MPPDRNDTEGDMQHHPRGTDRMNLADRSRGIRSPSRATTRRDRKVVYSGHGAATDPGGPTGRLAIWLANTALRREKTVVHPRYRGLSCRAQEQESRNQDTTWNDLMADTVAFLSSARTGLHTLSAQPSCDPQVDMALASASTKVFEALSALDGLSVTEWLKSGATDCGRSPIGQLPGWWTCLNQ
jgi:hypothetical protein